VMFTPHMVKLLSADRVSVKSTSKSASTNPKKRLSRLVP
jgi:hypothetical protein